MDGLRVAYASGGRIHVWNVGTGATSVVKGTYSNARRSDNAAEIAIAGTRVAWIKRQQLGNTEQPQRLYTAPVGGSATRLRRVLGYTDMGCGPGGSQIAGLVGSGNVLAVSTWQSSSNGMVPAKQRLNLITRTGLRPLASGSSAIVSASTDRGHIAVVPLPTSVWKPAEGYCDQTAPTSVAVYSGDGTLLKQIETGGPVAEVALSGKLLIVLPGTSPRDHSRSLGLDDRNAAAHVAHYAVAVPGQLRGSRTARHLLGALPPTIRQSKERAPTGSGHRQGRRDRNHHEQPLPRPDNGSARSRLRSHPFRNTRPGKLVFVPTATLLAALSK